MVKCSFSDCGEDKKTNADLSNHIKQKHKLSWKEYLAKYTDTSKSLKEKEDERENEEEDRG